MNQFNTNSWNRLRYTLYTPIYDSVAKIFNASRKLSIESLQIKSGDKVLIIGAGTGLDLEFIPDFCSITLTDLTPAMTKRIKDRNVRLKRDIEVQVMDGQALNFPPNHFNHVILHLILAVIPDPIACLKEAERVTRKGGKIVVFDKFVRKGKKANAMRKALNFFTNLLFSDITRAFEPLVTNTGLEIVTDIPADFNGNFRRILLLK